VLNADFLSLDFASNRRRTADQSIGNLPFNVAAAILAVSATTRARFRGWY